MVGLNDPDDQIPLAESKECRICYGDEKEDRLISPCRCSGSVRYIHLKCLEQWRTSTRNTKNVFQCDICHYKYQFSRVKLAQFLENPLTISILTFLIIATTVIMVAIFIRGFCYLLLGVKLSHSAFTLSSKIIWWSILLIGFIVALLTLLAVMLDDHNHVPAGGADLFRGFFDVAYYGNGPVFEFIGYGFSLTGFLVFVRLVYDYVFYQTLVTLEKLGNAILEVQHP